MANPPVLNSPGIFGWAGLFTVSATLAAATRESFEFKDIVLFGSVGAA
jgi:hypothetical protein